MKKVLLLLLVISSKCFASDENLPNLGSNGDKSAQAENRWTTAEKIGEITYLTLLYIDYRQTLVSIGNPTLKESNPFLGEHPSRQHVKNVCILTGAGQLALANYLSHDGRGLLIFLSAGAEAVTVEANRGHGIRINFLGHF